MTNVRIVDEKGYIKCSLVMPKSRVPPTKLVSIPRLKLTATTLSIKVSTILRRELTIPPTIKEYFWTDSEVLLGYVNKSRGEFILEKSDVNSECMSTQGLIWQTTHLVEYYHQTKKGSADG